MIFFIQRTNENSQMYQVWYRYISPRKRIFKKIVSNTIRMKASLNKISQCLILFVFTTLQRGKDAIQFPVKIAFKRSINRASSLTWSAAKQIC